MFNARPRFEQADLHDPIEYERIARRLDTPNGPVLKISYRRRDYWSVIRDRRDAQGTSHD